MNCSKNDCCLEATREVSLTFVNPRGSGTDTFVGTAHLCKEHEEVLWKSMHEIIGDFFNE